MIRGLLLVVAIMALAVPFFNKENPIIFGIPFFYCYQLAIVPIGSVLIFIVYIAESGDKRRTGR